MIETRNETKVYEFRRSCELLMEGTMVRLFQDDSTQSNRALQIWQVLIAKAANRQTITYGNLARTLGYESAGQFMSGLLNPVMRYCQVNGLPPLTVLVVNQETGKPGSGLSDALNDTDQDREHVFNHQWFLMFPPSPHELEEAVRSQNV